MTAFPPEAAADATGPRAGSGVKILTWPAQRAAVAQLERSAVPRLVLVDELSEPPVSHDCCQDWMWRSGGEREMRLRLHQLCLRALAHGHDQPELDGLGMLRVGLRSVHLPAKEQALAGLLLRDFGGAVARDELIRAAWPSGISRPNMLASRISTLRARVAWLGLEITGSSRTGYCLRVADPAPDGDASGFQDELDEAGWEARPGAQGGRFDPGS